MKIDFGSDLHVYGEFFDWENYRNEGSTILIIAGDTSNCPSRTFKIIEHAIPFYEYILFVDGNHEHYGSGKTIALTKTYLQQKTKDTNIYYLQQNVFILNDILFIGVNGWYNWNVSNTSYKDSKKAWKTYSNDSVYIKTGRYAIDSLAHSDVDRLMLLIQDYAQVVKKIVICTHTAPREDLLELKDPIWNSLNGSYCNTQMHQVLCADTSKKIKLWLYGHTHTRKDVIIDGIRYVNNARGYRAEIVEPWKLKQIEIENDTHSNTP
jgi:predicted phosphodiesterase